MGINNVYKYENQNLIGSDALNEEDFILLNIELAKKAMDIAYAKFDLVTEPDLVDSCIYELKASQLKYKYLIQKAKELGIIVNL